MGLLKKPIRTSLLLMVFLAIMSSIYPPIFAFVPSARNLFNSKPEVLLQSSWYIPIFMVHIGFASLAILSGSTQFFKGLRNLHIELHRNLGKVYVISVIPSGLAGLIIGFYATGTWYSKAGFMALALGWLLTTVFAYAAILKGNVIIHRIWMMRSYAFCFAFVTFRIYLMIGLVLGIPFYSYYSYLSFLSWIPNLIFIEWIIRRTK